MFIPLRLQEGYSHTCFLCSCGSELEIGLFGASVSHQYLIAVSVEVEMTAALSAQAPHASNGHAAGFAWLLCLHMRRHGIVRAGTI